MTHDTDNDDGQAAPRRVLFPELDDDEVVAALVAEEWDPARELPPLEPLEWPLQEAAAAAAVQRLGLWATQRAGALRPPILEALHALMGQIVRVADRRRQSASTRARRPGT